jgi:hypothetical protein
VLDGGGWSVSHPGCLTSRRETWYPLYMRLGGPQGLSGWVRKISPPPGFDPWTVQPVASWGPAVKRHRNIRLTKQLLNTLSFIPPLNIILSAHRTVYTPHFSHAFLITVCLYHQLIIPVHFELVKLELQADGHALCVFLFC